MNLRVICLKSFGDFVIALRSVQRVTDNEFRPTIVAGYHLGSLAAALGVNDSISFVGDSKQVDVPAAYDVKRLGISTALRSLIELRHHLGSGNPTEIRLFDHLGWREKLLSRRAQSVGLPSSANIYRAYSEYFTQRGLCLAPQSALRRVNRGTAILIATSRIARKSLPKAVIADVLSRLIDSGFTAHVIVLDGEQIELPSGAPCKRLPKSFSSLIDAVSSADLVVSADSLPAHLGEYFCVPTFVVTPEPNTYWLPDSAFATNGWCTFDETSRLSIWLEQQS